jgi:hypothetical protein
LNSGRCTCKADTTSSPHLQSILLRLFWRWRLGSHELFAWAGLKTTIPLISASQITRRTSMSHQHLALCIF